MFCNFWEKGMCTHGTPSEWQEFNSWFRQRKQLKQTIFEKQLSSYFCYPSNIRDAETQLITLIFATMFACQPFYNTSVQHMHSADANMYFKTHMNI